MKNILFFPFFLIALGAVGQNLVPDPGFEIHNTDCNTNPPGLTHWFNPNTATPDLWCMGECGDNIPDTFGEIYECPLPVEGGCYAGLHAATTNATVNHTRDYFSCELLSDLGAGQTYRVAFKTYRYETWGLAIDKLGVAFTSFAPVFDSPMIIPLEPQVESEGVILQADSSYWQLMEFYFTAEGGERYMTIGNFRLPTEMMIFNTGTGKFNNRAYHFFDEVVVETSTSVAEHSYGIASRVSLYNGVLTMSGLIRSQYEMYDLSGRQILSGVLAPGNSSKDVSFLPQGLYMVRISSDTVSKSFKVWKE
jgi:hypothetical protein